MERNTVTIFLNTVKQAKGKKNWEKDKTLYTVFTRIEDDPNYKVDSEEDVEEHPQEQSFSAKMPPNGKALHFHPSVLHFGMQLLGLPRAKMLYAYNPSRDREIVVNSVFTATRQFHVSPVHSRVIPAMGKISFKVLFLPTEEGSIESSLFINTSSHGVLSYQVCGMGTLKTSPEESRGQLSNAFLLIPHIQNIQISQTLAETTNASLLQVHLECRLPTSVYQQLKSCCFVSDDPMLLEMSLRVRIENAQQRLVDHRQYLLENVFVVYVAMGKTETSEDSTVKVYVMHSGNSLLHIQDVQHFSPKDASYVQFEPVLLLTSITDFTEVASVVCKAMSCDNGSHYAGDANMSPLEGTTLKACLSHPVVEGYFDLDPSAELFHIEPHHNTSGVWSIWFTNNFDFSIEVNDVFVARETKNILKILNFAEPSTLPPGCWNVFSLKLSVKDSVINISSSVILATNIGLMFAIPLQIYSTLFKQGDFHFEAIAHCDVHYYLGKSDTANLHWQRSLSLDHSTWNVDSELASEVYERWEKMKHGETCRRNFWGMTHFAHQKKPEEESFSFFLPRLMAEPGLTLNFSATALKNSMVKYFMLRNPSSFPVMLQLLPLSYYPDPQASLSLLSKWFGISMQAINYTTTEFRLLDECPHRDIHQEEVANKKSSSEVLHLHLQPLETKRVGVVFTPVDYKRVASLILIRNNLTVLDVVSVEGFGARELLKVGGRLPGAGGSLRFKVPEATLMDCRRQLKESKQILSITKNFKVENIGPLPITISSMKINGYSCQGYGFEVLDCQEFFLAQNCSRDISIVFTPDFTSSWVIREFTLVTTAGLEFHFTLNVTLPHHLLPLCADVVPGPSWEESFWRLTVLFVSLSLLGVILIAFQQAQYILAEFMKSRQRPNPSPSAQQNSNPVDIISSDSYKGSCKTFIDSYNSSDKGKGKGFLSVSAPSNRSQNAAKRSPATYSHSQKKHKCSVYYSKQKASTTAGSVITTTDEKQNQTVENQISLPKENVCTDIVGENWVTLKYANGININMQKNLTLSGNFLDKEESALKNKVLMKNTSSECDLKEDLETCMFPKETNLKISEKITELKEQEFCPVKTSKKLPESHLSRNSPQQQPELQEVSRKNNAAAAVSLLLLPAASVASRRLSLTSVDFLRTCSMIFPGNNQQVPLRNEIENCETLKKQINTKPSTEKKISKGPKEEIPCCGKQELASVEQEDAYRKKKSQEKKEGSLTNMNWNRNRTSRRNKKKIGSLSTRVPEQSEMKHMYSEFERPELRTNIGIRNCCAQDNGEMFKADQKGGSLSTQGETENFYQRSKKCLEKFCSDSSSDCGSSSGSVRASRGSWGSWSSTSSSDGDRKPIMTPRHFLPSRETISQNDFPTETPITLNLSHNICNTSRDINTIPQYPETLCPNFTDMTADPDKNKGLYPAGDLWPAQPVCLTNSLNYNLENNIPCMIQESPSVHNSFIDWNAACDGQFPNMYCPVEMNEYNAFPEENMNYASGFPCTAEVQNTAFLDHSCQSTWSAPPNMPPTWEPASYVNSSPYLSSTRSLSPMSGLFGSIWAPQSDVYENCCPLSATTQHSTHVENQAVMCKQEYYPRFNPFRAYMNLDIWTTAANRNANFPLSRDSGYCGNV
ncbi:transmembrane protein 131-like isoform X5 [Alligator mississippiensis]|uniref:transmembrane protein 131-like isoform X5 n=1 Tax=Alligator mississippiensis TaxID=8496 RepID=UPI0028780624|nr:transmembrane protein 131-like isoform X5 [Alligator mississippiensis]